MKNKNKSCLWTVVVIWVLIGLYYGFLKLKEGATIGDVVSGGGLVPNTRCITKKIEGTYSLSIVTDEADYKPYEKQQLEYRYEFSLTKDGCTVSGKNERRLGYTALDTITNKRSSLRDEGIGVDITGDITSDSLNLNIFVRTDDPKDCKVRAEFPFREDKIEILEGEFFGKCGLLHGTAKLKKK